MKLPTGSRATLGTHADATEAIPFLSSQHANGNWTGTEVRYPEFYAASSRFAHFATGAE